jgi:hypothetical protein
MPEGEHLKLIQGVITRMAGNSFLLKGWTVTLVAGLTALAKADSDRRIAWIACGAAALFAVLDAFYLAQERSYRELYADAVKSDSTVPAWSLAITKPGPGKVLGALFSWTILPLYLVAAAAAVFVATGNV